MFGHFKGNAVLVYTGGGEISGLGEVHAAISNWRQVALSPEIGLRAAELDDFAPAFEHEQMQLAGALVQG